MNNGSGMAPGTTLGGRFSGDAHHRYGGGSLRRGRPLQVPGEEIAQDSGSTSKEKALDEEMESSNDSTTMVLSQRLSAFRKGLPVTPVSPSPKSLRGPKPRPLHHLKHPLKQAPRHPPPKTVHTTQSG